MSSTQKQENVKNILLGCSNERVGDVMLGTHFVEAHFYPSPINVGTWQRSKTIGFSIEESKPMLMGSHNICKWTETETNNEGWSREVVREFNPNRPDPTRATALFEVVSVQQHLSSYNRSSGVYFEYTIVVQRMDGNRERIRYTRGCDSRVPPMPILSTPTPIEDLQSKLDAGEKFSPEEIRALVREIGYHRADRPASYL